MTSEVSMAVAPDCTPEFARKVFGVALGFLVITALLGVFLRWHHLWPMPGVDYAYFLHGHSHVAFLGWVFNAFFALALVAFVPAGEGPHYRRLFGVMQFAVLGMLVTFPMQGYGPASIAFSTVHMGATAMLAWRLWRRNRAVPLAREPLRVALVFLVVSGLGPLALGPLAAQGLRDSPWYQLAIYFYLHAQYNGWFVFFLLATLMQSIAVRGLAARREHEAAVAVRCLGVGAVLTFAQSTLWLGPPWWVYVVAAAGGSVQLAGCVYLLRTWRGAASGMAGAVRWLAALALVAFVAKAILQTLAVWPDLVALANHRYVVIAFLHLVFLGVVTPVVLARGLTMGWLVDNPAMRFALGLFFTGAVATELVLVAASLGATLGAPPTVVLFAAALAMAVGAGLLVAGYLWEMLTELPG